MVPKFFSADSNLDRDSTHSFCPAWQESFFVSTSSYTSSTSLHYINFHEGSLNFLVSFIYLFTVQLSPVRLPGFLKISSTMLQVSGVYLVSIEFSFGGSLKKEVTSEMPIFVSSTLPSIKKFAVSAPNAGCLIYFRAICCTSCLFLCTKVWVSFWYALLTPTLPALVN